MWLRLQPRKIHELAFGGFGPTTKRHEETRIGCSEDAVRALRVDERSELAVGGEVEGE